MNSTTNKVLEYESLFERLFGTEVFLRFEAPLNEMIETASYLGCHLAQPFEDGYTQDCYRFTFISERNKDLVVTVNSKEKYRINKQIVEI